MLSFSETFRYCTTEIQKEHFRKLIKEIASYDIADRPSFEKIIQQIKCCVKYDIHEKIVENGVLLKVHRNMKLGEGGFAVVLYGTLQQHREHKYAVAVKRIDVTHSASSKREEDALKELRHSNVIRLFHATSDNNFRFFLSIYNQSTAKLLHISNF